MFHMPYAGIKGDGDFGPGNFLDLFEIPEDDGVPTG